jgi:hypothetical protein
VNLIRLSSFRELRCPTSLRICDEGDRCLLFRNMSCASGLVKGWKCSALGVHEPLAAGRLDIGQELTLSHIPMEKISNGMQFSRWQMPTKLICAGTVHRSQGITFESAVIDLRTNLWEHGQLSVALSRVRQPDDICILLHNSSNLDREIDPRKIYIHVSVDPEIARIRSIIYSNHIRDVSMTSPGAESASVVEYTGS